MASTVYEQKDIDEIISTTFKIPKLNRPIYEFLFNNLLTSIFHKNYKVPPQALTYSLPTLLKEEILPLPPHDKQQADVMPLWGKYGIKVRNNFLIVPISLQYPYSLGYTYTIPGVDESQESCRPVGIRGSPFEQPWVGRFVSDVRTGDFLNVTYGGSPSCIGLNSIIMLDKFREQHDVVTVPAIPYEWPYLPSTILSRISAIIEKSTPTQLYSPISSSITNSFWSNDNMPDGTYPHYHPKTICNIDNNNNDYMFSESGLEKCEDALSYFLTGGRRTTPQFKMDFLMSDTLTFQSTTALVKHSEIAFDRVSKSSAIKIREKFATMYYLQTMPISHTMPLLKPADVSEASNQNQVEIHLGNSDNNDSAINSQIEDIVNDYQIFPGLPPDAFQLDDIENPAQLEINLNISPDNINNDDIIELSSSGNTSINNNCIQHNSHDTSTLPSSSPSPSPSPSQNDSTQKSVSPQCSSTTGPTSTTIPEPIVTIPTQTQIQSHVQPSVQFPATTGATAEIFKQFSAMGATPLAPRPVQPASVAIRKRNRLANKVEEESRRHEMLEARRRRNRLSAARSNERKKLEFERLKKETDMEKKRLQSLNEKQMQIAKENQILKAAIAEKLTMS